MRQDFISYMDEFVKECKKLDILEESVFIFQTRSMEIMANLSIGFVEETPAEEIAKSLRNFIVEVRTGEMKES